MNVRPLRFWLNFRILVLSLLLAGLGLPVSPAAGQDGPPRTSRREDAPPPPLPGPELANPDAAEVSATASEFRPIVLKVDESRNSATVPASVADLIDLEARIRAVVEKALPATVGLVIGQGQGSGVIISPDGYVLTAAHVAGKPGARVWVILPDGTRYRGISLGVNRRLDDGLVKITDPDATDIPWVPLGSADELPVGSWTVALGHPGGYQKDRPPVVRVGRILTKGNDFLRTDNTLVGGDSGGPLFDLDGRVIGIHSRIEGNIVSNVHVPADRFLEDWESLVDSQDLGGREVPEWLRRGAQAADGLNFDPADVGKGGARVVRVVPQSPAQAAGFQVNDRIIGMNGTSVSNGQELMLRRMGLRAGVAVKYEVRRGQETLELELTPVPSDSLRRPDYQRERDPLRPVMGIIPDQRHPGPGVRLEGVQDKGPAMAAGLQGGDILTSFDGQFLRNSGEMSELMLDREVGDIVKLGVTRGDQKLDVELELRSFRDVFPADARRR